MEFGDEESACTTWENSDVFSRFTDGNDDGNDEAPEEESDGNDGDTEGIGTEDHVLVYPRRKHGQERLGSERPPVVVTREYLESNYNIPLTVVAKNLVSTLFCLLHLSASDLLSLKSLAHTTLFCRTYLRRS